MQRVLVVLPNWFGETLFATPFVRALRVQCPAAFIATLGPPRCRDVLAHNPRLNLRIDYGEAGRHRPLTGKWQMVRALRAHRFDTAFILRRSLSRTALLALAGIPIRVGFANPKSGWLLTHRVDPPALSVHKASTYLPLLEAVGLSVMPGPYEYTVSEEERRQAHTWWRTQPLADGRPVVVLHPGANWPHKRWALERFAALGERLVASRLWQVVLTGGPDDRLLAQRIAHTMREAPLVLAGQTTVRELAAFLERVRLLISNDTGILHIAAALGRPVVGLYGPTSPSFTGPLGDPSRTVVIHHVGSCPQIPCYQPDHPAYPGMDAISVDEVYQATLTLLQRYA